MDEEAQYNELKLLIGGLQEFADRVQESLQEADWATRRQIIRTLVKQVEVEQEQIRIVYRVNPPPFVNAPDRGGLQDCLRRVSSILMNIVLHEFDRWMEDHWQANPAPLTSKQQQARMNPEYARHKRNLNRWRAQLNGRIPIGHQTEQGLKGKIKEALAERKRIPCLLPRQARYYCRYADDYVVVLCNHSKEEARHLKEAIMDLFMSVNALMRGWTQYYRYANNATQRFGYLTGMVYWLTAHYLGRKHRRSIKQVMRTRYGVDSKTGKRALYTIQPGGKRLFIWNRPPQRRSILTGWGGVQDICPVMMTTWAGGHSYEQRLDLQTQCDHRCQHCGQVSAKLVVHHPNRLAQCRHRKQGPANVIQSAQEQEAKLLCPDCHRQHHPNGWHDATA